MPPIHCGRRIRDIKTAVRHLDHIAKRLKAKRFHGGALKLDLPKLKFDVEKSSSGIWQPRGIRLDEVRMADRAFYSFDVLLQRRDANFLVEEFMLLANMEVAQRLYKHFNLRALLRRHPSPKKKELATLVR
jgi:exoribonuclease R